VEVDARPTAAGGETAQTVGGPPGAAGVSPLPPAASQTEVALLDLVQGARAHHLWGLLGWQDIRRRYRRSILGPFWITISLGVFVAALGTLYGALLKVELAEYVPYLALGFIVWTLISNMLTDGCTVFTAAEGIIKQVNQPLSVHLCRILWRSFIIFCHNAVIFVVVAVLFSVWPGVTGLLALPGLVLVCLNGAWAGLLLGIVSARFRDLPPLVESIMRVAFFLTPIIWMPSLLPGRGVLLEFNPFFHLLELVRAPMLGQLPGLVSWLAVAGITLGGWLVTFVMFRRYRRRIAYWI
jgi:ABC-type polysaccharide/polyol phosphate export permease